MWTLGLALGRLLRFAYPLFKLRCHRASHSANDFWSRSGMMGDVDGTKSLLEDMRIDLCCGYIGVSQH